MSLLFLSFFTLAATTVAATVWVVATQIKDALTINLAGRQWMLIQQADDVVRMYEPASEDKMERLTRIQATFFLSALILLKAGFLLTKKPVRSPFHSLALNAEKISQGNLETRVEATGPFEIDTLAGSPRPIPSLPAELCNL